MNLSNVFECVGCNNVLRCEDNCKEPKHYCDRCAIDRNRPQILLIAPAITFYPKHLSECKGLVYPESCFWIDCPAFGT